MYIHIYTCDESVPVHRISSFKQALPRSKKLPAHLADCTAANSPSLSQRLGMTKASVVHGEQKKDGCHGAWLAEEWFVVVW